MGSVPIHTVISHLKNNPSSVVWSSSRDVTLFRGQSSKLGLTFKTVSICQQAAGVDYCTVIIRIKDTCNYSGSLSVFDRILSINGYCITRCSESQVSEIFADRNVSEYQLVVQSLQYTDDSRTKEMSSEQLLPKNKTSMSSPRATPANCSIERTKITGSNKNLLKSISHEHNQSVATSPSVVSPFEGNFKSSSPKRLTEHSAAHLYHPLSENELAASPHYSVDGAALLASSHVFYQSDVHPPGVPMSSQYDRAGLETVNYNRTQSLPVTYDDDIGLEEITCEVQSLPLQAGVYSSGIVASSSFSTQDSGLGAIGSQESGHTDISVCSSRSCHLQHCVWHMAVLKYPEYVIWDPDTKTINLEKGSQSAYGFHYKVKEHSHPRDTFVYVLVDYVKPRMPAYGKLEVGDWIRSVDGQALQTSKEANSLNLNQSSSLRLVIQRPKEILPKAAASLTLTKKTLQPLKMPQQPRSSSSPVRQQTSLSGKSAKSPRTPVSPFQNVSANRAQNCKLQTPEKSSPDYVFSDSSSPAISMIMSPSGFSSGSPREVPVPKVRIFICGNKSNVFANLLMMRASEEARIPLESHVHYSRLCLRKNDQSGVTFDKWQYGLTENRNESYTSDSLQNNPYFKFSSNHKQINADIFVIWDENFFHHCSHFLFTKHSVFLIAFDAHKLLNSASTEISRIENMLHTIRSFASDSALVKLYGVLSSDTVKADEVRTLFYTSHGKQFSRFAISIPDIGFIQKDEDTNDLNRLRCSVFDIVNLALAKQTVSLKSLQLSDTLSGKEGRTKCIWSSEELAHLLQSVYEENILKTNTAQEMIELGDLVPLTDTDNADRYIIPVDILPRLAHLVLWAGVETSPHSVSLAVTEAWTKLLTTATVTHKELLILLDKNIMNSAMFVTCLESLGIIFRISHSHGIVSKDTTYLIPYFLIECPPSEQVSEETSHELFVVFENRVPWVTFFRIISGLARLSECSRLEMSGQYCCLLWLDGVHVSVLFQKMNDRVRILVQRGHGTTKESAIFSMIKKILISTMPADHHYIFGPVCPLVDNHRGSTAHIVDISHQSNNICCSGIILDQHPAVRMWMSSPSSESNEDSAENKLNQNIGSLPFSVLHNVVVRLSIEDADGWETMAGLIGKTLDEVNMYRTVRSFGTFPAEELLKDWGHSADGTIGRLLQILKEMRRDDIVECLSNYLKSES